MSGLNWQRRWDPFRDLQREVGRLFESFEPLQAWRLARHEPSINLYDGGDRYFLSAQLPGMNPEDLDLSITGETLTLRESGSGRKGCPTKATAARSVRSGAGPGRCRCRIGWIVGRLRPASLRACSRSRCPRQRVLSPDRSQ